MEYLAEWLINDDSVIDVFNLNTTNRFKNKSVQENSHSLCILKHSQHVSCENFTRSVVVYDYYEKLATPDGNFDLEKNIILTANKPTAACRLSCFVQLKKKLQVLSLSFPKEYTNLVQSAQFFLHNSTVKSLPYFHIEPLTLSSVSLKLHHETRQIDLSFNLSYSIHIDQAIFSRLPPIVHYNLNMLVDLLYFPNPTKYQSGENSVLSPPSVSSFYSLITENTAKHYNNTEIRDLHIKGITKTLLPYQIESLKWLLLHENIQMHVDKGKEITLTKLKIDNLEDENCISEWLDKLCPGWTRLERYGDCSNKYWYNAFSGSICDVAFATNYLYGLQNLPPAKAFLCEEMGLGKTLEIICLVKLNPRENISSEAKPYLLDSSRLVKESKTTIVLCPETIINQWFEEVKNSSMDLSVHIYDHETYRKDDTDVNPTQIANDLSNYDILLVSYTTLANELDRALFKPTTRPKRQSSSYERIDYSSPLMLLEFYRLIIDEAQLASIGISKVAHFSRILPRVHSWCVSGTLIRRDLQDLNSLLKSQQLYPLDKLNSQQWKEFPRYLFDRLFKSKCLRHTKEMVGDQVRLPKQTRIMLRSPFTTIEHDNYYNLFERFLEQVGLNEKGEPIVEGFDLDRSRMGMKVWASKLRMACCHALLNTAQFIRNLNTTNTYLSGDGFITKSKGKIKKTDDLMIGTLNDVLFDLIYNNETESYLSFTNYVRNYIKLGKIYEFLRDPTKSVSIFETIIKDLDEKIRYYKKYQDEEENGDKKRTWNTRIRGLQELLHQAYFLLASAHYQHYKPMHPLPDNFTDLVKIQGSSDTASAPKIEAEESFVDFESLDDEAKKHYHLENEYYSKADNILNQLLEDPLKRTIDMIRKLNKTFQKFTRSSVIPLSNSKADTSVDDTFETEKVDVMDVCRYFSDMDLGSNVTFGMSFILNRANEAIKQMNEQALIINIWITQLFDYQKLNVVKDKDVDDKTGEEYKSSLVLQERSQAYIDQIQLILEDREKALDSIIDASFNSRPKKQQRLFNSAQVSGGVDNQTNELYIQLEKLRKYYLPQGVNNPRYSIRTSILELTGELDQFSPNSNEYLHVSAVIDGLKKELTDNIKNLKNIRRVLFDVLNDTFNSKVLYFKSLQIRSDSLVNYFPERLSGSPKYSALIDVQEINKEMQKYTVKINGLNARLSYLKSLSTKRSMENQSDSENDDSCVICRFRILVGTLTPCGHKYCRECLNEWMKTKKTCPLCSKTLRGDELYNFTYSKGGLKGGVVESVDSHTEEIKEIKIEEREDDHLNDHSDNDNDDPDVETDTDNIRMLKNRIMFEKDLDIVYQGLPNDQLRDISSIFLKRNYGTKVDMIVRQVKYLKSVDSNVQILIFSQWNSFLLLLGRALVSENIEIKSWKDNKKSISLSKSIKEFKGDSRNTCFLLNTVAQAAGLTFTNASHVFLCEPMVNLSFELQAINRIHRIGQTKETTVWSFIIEGTIEESIAYLSTKKRIQAAKVRSRVEKDNIDNANVAVEVEVEVEEIDDNILEAKELTKINDINKEEGEVINDEDLWAAFFAARSAKIMNTVYE